MDEHEWLARRFEAHRTHLLAVGYRMLGSLSEAEDAVQEAWLRLCRSNVDGVENLGGWLTTVVARVCLDQLRSRSARREEPAGAHLPDPIVSPDDGLGPEQQALLADSVGLALLVVVQTLTPEERLAFVLHDMFALPFAEIAPIVGRSPNAAKQLASRARRRVRDATPVPDTDLARHRAIVDAFLEAARGGRVDALVAILDPDVVLRADRGGTVIVRGAADVAARALAFADLAPLAHPVLVNGTPGLVATSEGQPLSVLAFTIARGRIVEIDVLADIPRLHQLIHTRAQGMG